MAKAKKKAGAPIGNQNGVGHGRPPNPGYSDEELVALGEELLVWIKECDDTKFEVVHLSQFYSELKEMPRTQWQSICLRDCFKPYYDRARDWIGKRILLNKDMPTAYGSRFLGIYFNEVREHEMKVVEHKVDYEIKKRADLLNSATKEMEILGVLNGIKNLSGDSGSKATGKSEMATE